MAKVESTTVIGPGDGAELVEVDRASSCGLAGVSATTSIVRPGPHGGGERAGLGAVDERDVDAEAGADALQEQLACRE